MSTIAKREKRTLLCYLFFDGILSAKCVEELLYYMDDQCHAIIGIRFRDNGIDCGVLDDNKTLRKDQVAAYLSQLPPANWALFTARSTPFCTQFGVPSKGFYFTFAHPLEPDKTPYSSLELNIEYLPPFEATGQAIVQIMHHWVAILKKQEVYIKYGYIEPMGKFHLERHDEMYCRKPIPNHKLMGVRWGNLLTKQHLGEKPEQLLAAINRAIAPEKIVSIAPDLYWFTLPFDLKSYSQATHPNYQAMMRQTLEAIKPYKVLWRNGIRKYFS